MRECSDKIMVTYFSENVLNRFLRAFVLKFPRILLQEKSDETQDLKNTRAESTPSLLCPKKSRGFVVEECTMIWLKCRVCTYISGRAAPGRT